MTLLATATDGRAAPPPVAGRVGYVLKMYPRFSETFIVNEILAHEAAGLELAIFSLRTPTDGRFHGALADVRAPVTYIPVDHMRASDLWAFVRDAALEFPALWDVLQASTAMDVHDVLQSIHVARAARANGVVHLHAHFATLAATVARLAAELAGITYSFTAHAKDIFHEAVDATGLRTLIEAASAVVTISEFNLEHLRREFGCRAGNVHLVYNGLDLERFPYRAATGRGPEIVAVGRLIEKKGFEDLVEACAIMRAGGTTFRCQVVGTGPLEGALRERILAHGLEEQVALVGPKPQHQVIELVQRAAAFAAPCVVGTDGNRDGLPTVLLEAMALGTPCVGTPVTGIPEVVIDGETGFLVPEHDPSALARALTRLIAEPALGVRLATNARALIEERFDIAKNTVVQRRHFAASIAEGRAR